MQSAEAEVQQDVKNEVRSAVKEAIEEAVSSEQVLTGTKGGRKLVHTLVKDAGKEATRAEKQEVKEYSDEMSHITNELDSQLGGLVSLHPRTRSLLCLCLFESRKAERETARISRSRRSRSSKSAAGKGHKDWVSLATKLLKARQSGSGWASSKRLIGQATRWNPRGFGFIKPSDGSEDLFCLLSSIADGNELREGVMVEYEAEYDDRRGKYQAIKVTRKAARKLSGNTRKKRTKLPAPAPATGGGYPTSTYGAPASFGVPTSAPYIPIRRVRASSPPLTSPSYTPISPSYMPTSPSYSPCYGPNSPPYMPTSPRYNPTSPSPFLTWKLLEGLFP